VPRLRVWRIKYANTATRRNWAKALIYFALSINPGLKSGAIGVIRVLVTDVIIISTPIAPAFKPGSGIC
jgi:hypothetical protein